MRDRVRAAGPRRLQIEWLRALSATWTEADVPGAKADVLHAMDDQIVVTGREIVSVRLTPSASAHGLALALPTKVELARPTGVGRAFATHEIPIDGRDGWLAAARRLAWETAALDARRTERPLVVAAVLDAGSEKAAQLVWILAPRLPEPEGGAEADS